MNLVWTKKQPTEIGWYWLRDFAGDRIVYVRKYVDKLCIENWPIPDKNIKWAGPIPSPKPIVNRKIKK